MMKKSRQSWAALKEEYVERRLSGEMISLARFAAEHRIDRRSVERHSVSEGWLRAVEERAQERLHAAMAQQAMIVNTLYPAYHANMLRSKFRVR